MPLKRSQQKESTPNYFSNFVFDATCARDLFYFISTLKGDCKKKKEKEKSGKIATRLHGTPLLTEVSRCQEDGQV